MKAWFKYILILIIRNTLKAFSALKINNNKIVLQSFGGRQISCSPKYIMLYLNNQEPKKYEFYWAVDDIGKFREWEEYGVKLVKFKSLRFLILSITAKVFITNGYVPSYIPFRKKQFVLSTWHGGGAYKRGGLDIVNNIPSYKIVELQTASLSKMISSCVAFSEIFHKSFLIPNDKFLNCGLPRNDILINRNVSIMKKVKNKLQIPQENKVIIYAPTFRSDIGSIEEKFENGNFKINYKNLIGALKDKFSGNWTVLFRTHYFLKSNLDSNDAIDVSDYPDMQELLCAADILITDYSSCMWDFSLMYKPCFIFATDIAKYKQERDFYTPMSEWPFPIASNNEELVNNILNFNEADYIEKVKQHHKALGSYEDGHACERVCKLIEEICTEGK